MKKQKIRKALLAIALLLTLTGCQTNQEGGRQVIKDPGGTITIIDGNDQEGGKAVITVEKIDRYEAVEISGWIDEKTVVLSKENQDLDKMRLLELAEFYPRSLYLFNLENNTDTLLKEQENIFLGEAVPAPDKRHLLYTGYSLGDPIFYVMNLESLEGFQIGGSQIAGAMSAQWADSGTVIGAAYNGGAYLAGTGGEITKLEDLNGEALVIVEKIGEQVYYNTSSDESLQVYDLTTKEKVTLDFSHVRRLLPSPDRNQLLVYQHNGTKGMLVLCEPDGSNRKTIAEGAEVSGLSWSPDQRMIAYGMKTTVNGNTVNGLYVYDLLTDSATQIAVDIERPAISWSPSGTELAYNEWDGRQYNSSIVYLSFTE